MLGKQRISGSQETARQVKWQQHGEIQILHKIQPTSSAGLPSCPYPTSYICSESAIKCCAQEPDKQTKQTMDTRKHKQDRDAVTIIMSSIYIKQCVGACVRPLPPPLGGFLRSTARIRGPLGTLQGCFSDQQLE